LREERHMSGPRNIAGVVEGTRSRTQTLFALSLMVALAGLGCEPAPEVASAPEGATVRLVSYQAGPDGQMTAVEQVISHAQYRAMHARRAARQKGGGEIEQSQQALQYLGHGGVGCSGSTCQDPNVICADNRTTWMYNVANGWDTTSSSLVIGCVGAGSGSWTGTVDLRTATFPNPIPFIGNQWSHGIRSMWTSDTYSVRMQTVPMTTPVIDQTFGTWQIVNFNQGLWGNMTHL